MGLCLLLPKLASSLRRPCPWLSPLRLPLLPALRPTELWPRPLRVWTGGLSRVTKSCILNIQWCFHGNKRPVCVRPTLLRILFNLWYQRFWPALCNRPVVWTCLLSFGVITSRAEEFVFKWKSEGFGVLSCDFPNVCQMTLSFLTCFLAKDSRLQDQRQNSPAGNKENIKASETSPGFSKAENKGQSVLKNLAYLISCSTLHALFVKLVCGQCTC